MTNLPSDPWKKPVSRRACITVTALWLLVMCLPCLILVFVMRGEFSWQRQAADGDRLWLVATDDADGLGYSATRPLTITADLQCRQTSTYFFLWRGETSAATYCECYARNPAGDWQSTPACP